MTWTNNNKTSGTWANVAHLSKNLTWDEATFEWQNAGGATWDDPTVWTTNAKTSGSWSNTPKT